MPDPWAEKYKPRFEALQALLVSLAVLVGGAWTVSTYMLGREPQIKEAEKELRWKEVEQYRDLVPDVKIAASSLEQGRGCVLDVTVEVHNNSKSRIRLGFQRPPLAVAAAAPDGDSLLFTPLRQASIAAFTVEGDEVLHLPVARLLPGESAVFPFLVPVPAAGLYFLQFQVPVSADPPDTAQGRNVAWYWTSRTFARACLSGRAASRRTSD